MKREHFENFTKTKHLFILIKWHRSHELVLVAAAQPVVVGTRSAGTPLRRGRSLPVHRLAVDVGQRVVARVQHHLEGEPGQLLGVDDERAANLRRPVAHHLGEVTDGGAAGGED